MEIHTCWIYKGGIHTHIMSSCGSTAGVVLVIVIPSAICARRVQAYISAIENVVLKNKGPASTTAEVKSQGSGTAPVAAVIKKAQGEWSSLAYTFKTAISGVSPVSNILFISSGKGISGVILLGVICISIAAWIGSAIEPYGARAVNDVLLNHHALRPLKIKTVVGATGSDFISFH